MGELRDTTGGTRDERRGVQVFTYIGLIKVTPEGREQFDQAPEYLAKIGEAAPCGLAACC